MKKNLVITGLAIISTGLAIELKNLSKDFKTLLEDNCEKQRLLDILDPIVVDAMFEDRMKDEE